jgi:hypothetical protein
MSASALPRAEPESVGLSSARLRRIGEALRRDIDAGQLPGAVIGIMRAGQLAHLEAVGHRDPATREPLKTDAVFSIASMTKAMTSTAIMSRSRKVASCWASVSEVSPRWRAEVADLRRHRHQQLPTIRICCAIPRASPPAIAARRTALSGSSVWAAGDGRDR